MTDDAFRPRRSVLYMPSSNERALEKAKSIPCDGLILDLEDAVAPEAKPGAREAACAAVRSGEYGRRELTIRLNGADTEWHVEDLKAACAAGPDAIVVPKVNSADAVLQLVEAMGDGTGAVMLDGKMEDDASLKQCLVLVELAEQLAEIDPALKVQYDAIEVD